MNSWLIRSLKYLAMTAIFSLFVPFVAVGHFLVNGKTDKTSVLFFAVLIIAVGYFGYFAAFVIYHFSTKFPIILLNIIRILIGICAAGAVGFVAKDSIIFSIIMVLLYAVAYFYGGHCYTVSYDSILSANQFTFTIIINLITCFLMWLMNVNFGYPYDLSVLVPPFLLFTAAYYLVLNQANLDELMNRRHHKLSQLPQKIRYYNAFLTTLVLTLIVGGYIFRESIVKMLIWVGELLKAIVRWIVAAMQWLINLRRVGDPVLLPPALGGDNELFEKETEKKGSNYLEWFLAAMVIIIIVLLIKYRKPIFAFIREKFQQLFGFIKRILLKTAAIKRLEQPSEEYVDTVETLSRDRALPLKEAKISVRSWKKSHQKFTRMENSSAKLRFGYHLVLDGLTLTGVAIAASDTTTEIMHKVDNAALALPTATNSYNNIRYGDLPLANADISGIESTLTHLREALGNIK